LDLVQSVRKLRGVPDQPEGFGIPDAADRAVDFEDHVCRIAVYFTGREGNCPMSRGFLLLTMGSKSVSGRELFRPISEGLSGIERHHDAGRLAVRIAGQLRQGCGKVPQGLALVIAPL